MCIEEELNKSLTQNWVDLNIEIDSKQKLIENIPPTMTLTTSVDQTTILLGERAK